jgi:hypothetical protein
LIATSVIEEGAHGWGALPFTIEAGGEGAQTRDVLALAVSQYENGRSN